MSQTPLGDEVMGAIADVFLKQENSPIPTAYIALVSIINEDGSTAMTVLRPESQPTHVSLGFVTFADEWFRDDVRFQINQLCADTEDE